MDDKVEFLPTQVLREPKIKLRLVDKESIEFLEMRDSLQHETFNMQCCLATVDLNQLPSTQRGSDDQFEQMSRSTGFLGRLQLFSKGNAIDEGLIPPGTYGIPELKVVKLGSQTLPWRTPSNGRMSESRGTTAI